MTDHLNMLYVLSRYMYKVSLTEQDLFTNIDHLNMLYLLSRYMYKVSLAEQDLFTNIDFDYPKLIKILPCQFNAQMSIQVFVVLFLVAVKLLYK